MSSRYIIYYANSYYIVTLAGEVDLRYEVRSIKNPHRVLATYSASMDAFGPGSNAGDMAIDDADERELIAIEDADAARDAAEARRPSRKHKPKDTED